MAASPESLRRRILAAAGLGAAAVLCWAFPPFRIVSLTAPGRDVGVVPGAGAFDAAAAARRVWTTDLPAAADRAAELRTFAAQLLQDPAAARRLHARSSGLGTSYYFVRGRGRVVDRDRHQVRLALEGAEGVVIALRTGPVFGNTVRDGCGLLDVNQFPGLQEYNALAAELNALVERDALPALRTGPGPGALVSFTGCAEAPDSPPAAGAPALLVIPVRVEVQP